MKDANTLYKVSKREFLASELPSRHVLMKNTFSSLREYDPSKDIYLNNIAHELRTPINVVLGSIQLFEMMGDDLFHMYNRNKFKVYNNIMKKNCYRLLRVVNNLIDVSRIEADSFSLCVSNRNIVDIVKEIIDNTEKYTAEKGIALKFHAYSKTIVTAFDEDKLSRALLNLLSNAIKFTGKGGTINVTVKKKAETIYISVKDTGIGIPEDQLNNIFKRFSQVDKTLSRSHEGGGIGLSLADSIVRLHDGIISVKSKPGKGSTFTIELPVKIIDDNREITGSELNLSPAEKVKIELSDL